MTEDKTHKPPKYSREFWTGDSRDGELVAGEGYHYLEMNDEGKVIDAYEVYEKDDGTVVVSIIPEMKNVFWLDDLGFEDYESLEIVDESEFMQVRESVGSGELML